MKFLQANQYQSKCAVLFGHYKNKIIRVLPKAQIEHIGSSAIPDCISKGDLDIYVAVAFEEHQESIGKLESLDFSIKEDTLRTEHLCMLESNKAEDVAIQLVVSGSKFENFLDFKSALISSPQLVKDYNHMKQACAGWHQDQYREVKSRFIENTLESLYEQN